MHIISGFSSAHGGVSYLFKEHSTHSSMHFAVEMY